MQRHFNTLPSPISLFIFLKPTALQTPFPRGSKKSQTILLTDQGVCVCARARACGHACGVWAEAERHIQAKDNAVCVWGCGCGVKGPACGRGVCVVWAAWVCVCVCVRERERERERDRLDFGQWAYSGVSLS